MRKIYFKKNEFFLKERLIHLFTGLRAQEMLKLSINQGELSLAKPCDRSVFCLFLSLSANAINDHNVDLKNSREILMQACRCLNAAYCF